MSKKVKSLIATIVCTLVLAVIFVLFPKEFIYVLSGIILLGLFSAVALCLYTLFYNTIFKDKEK